MIKVMIADDNTAMCESCFKFLTNDEDIKVVSFAFNGEDALNKYLAVKPDVLLLDLDLPIMSGIDVINKLHNFYDEKFKCNIIVVSGSFDKMHQLYNTAQIYRVIPKPTDYNYILKTIKEVRIKDKELNQKKLKDLLLELKLNIYNSNIRNLITAINIAYNQPYLLNNMNDLYTEVSSQTGITSESIKWSIRNAIGILTRSMTIEELCTIFSLKITIDNLTPKRFITLVVSYFNQD